MLFSIIISNFLSPLSICCFSLLFFFSLHFDYFKLGPVGGSRGDSESDQWGASPSRSHQPVLKVRARSPAGCVYGILTLHQRTVTPKDDWVLCLFLENTDFFLLLGDGHFTDVLKALLKAMLADVHPLSMQIQLLSVGAHEACH